MVSVNDFLNASITHFGHPYSTTNRFGPVNYDCSGHVWASLNKCGFRWSATTSSTMYKACFPIPLSAAVKTPGALIFMPNNPLQGIGSSGHVAIVLNPYGYTSEARGHAWGVGSWGIAGRGFSAQAGLIPAVDYKGVTPPPIISNPVLVAVATEVAVAVNFGNEPLGFANQTLTGGPSTGDEVIAWQNALNITMEAQLAVDGWFGPATAEATGRFQRAYNYLAGRTVLNMYGIVDNGQGQAFDGTPVGHVRSAMVAALNNVIKTHGG